MNIASGPICPAEVNVQCVHALAQPLAWPTDSDQDEETFLTDRSCLVSNDCADWTVTPDVH